MNSEGKAGFPHSNCFPVSAAPYLRLRLNSAAVEPFLTRLGVFD